MNEETFQRWRDYPAACSHEGVTQDRGLPGLSTTYEYSPAEQKEVTR
jgi:hypothetical protein